MLGPFGTAVPGLAGAQSQRVETWLGQLDAPEVQSGQDYVYHVRAVNFIGVGRGALQAPPLILESLGYPGNHPQHRQRSEPAAGPPSLSIRPAA